MMSLTTCEPASAREMCLFLADYAGWLFSCGATCIRLEKNVSRIAARAGMEINLSIMPRHIHLTVKNDNKGQIFTSIATIEDRPVNYEMNTLLSRLSWDIADGRVSIEEGRKRFAEIIASRLHSKSAVLLLASVGNAAFCGLFGGDAVAIAVVFAATMAGLYLRQAMSSKGIDFRLIVIVCSFVSSVLAAADGLFGLGSTPDIAIGTSVLYLVPGIPFINSFCDMIDRHYICAMSRLMNAAVTTCCLSGGLCAGMMLMNVGMF